MAVTGGTVALNIWNEGLFVEGLIDNDEKVASSKKGVSNGLTEFKSARKIWPLLELLAKLDEFSLARARKIFATARMLEFSLKFPYGKTYWETLRKNARAMNVSGNISFILVLPTFYWNWHE